MSEPMTGIDYTLKRGNHDSPEEGMCAMEWVAYLAGEPHSDSPKCVDPPLRDFAISLNDNWDDEQRQKLRPFLARCIGTAGDGRTEERGWLAMDWLIREFTPAYLDLRPELTHHAEKLRSLSPVLAEEALDEARVLLREAREDAAAAACDAAWDGTAAWAAVRIAARAAASYATRATAWAAASDATRVATKDALTPTVTRLQASALDLFDRMIGQGEIVELPPEKATEYERLLGATFVPARRAA